MWYKSAILQKLGGYVMQPREVTKWEQHFGAVTQAVVVALLIWTGTSLIGLREQVAVMEVKVTSLQTTVSAERTDGYRTTDAARDFSAVRDNINHLETRIEKLEGRLDRR